MSGFLSEPILGQTNYVCKHLKQDDGLPQNSVSNIYFSQSGFLWFTTEDGLIKYDGSKIFVYNSRLNSNIKNDRFRSILPTINGKVYTQTSDGNFFEIINHQVEPIENFGNKGLEIYGILPEKSVFYTFAKSQFFKASHHKTYATPYQIYAIDSSQFLMLGIENILVINPQGIQQKIKLPRKDSYTLFQVASQFYLGTKTGIIYFVNYKTGQLERCNLQGLHISSKKQMGLRFFSNDFYKPSFIINDKNLYTLSIGDKPTHLLTHFKLVLPTQTTYITTIAGNTSGDYFAIGTSNDGIYIYRKAYFKSLDYSLDRYNLYHAITAINEGVLSANQHVFTDSLFKWYPLSAGQIGGNTLYYHQNILWFYKNESLYKFNTKTKETSLIYSDRYSISCINGKGDSLFVGTSNGIIYLFKEKVVGVFNAKDKEFSNVTTINFSHVGEIYFGNCDDLFKIISIKNQKIKVQALQVNACIRDIIFYKDRLFLCTYGKGIIVQDKGVFKLLPADKDAFLDKTHSLQIDEEDHFWFSTNNGIFETKLPLILNYLKDTSYHILYNRYGTRLGMKSAEFNGGCYPASAKDSKGNLYFPSIQGLVCFDPKALKKANKLMPIYIDQIYLNSLPVSSSDSVVYVGTEIESVKIKLLSSQWLQKAEFEYQLLGYNKAPVRLVNDDDIISFTNLPAGEFMLKIRNTAGLDSNSFPEKHIRIMVEERYYEKAWFQLLLIIIFGSFIFAANQLNNKLLVKRNQALEQTIESRTDELMKINDVLYAANQNLKQSVGVKNKLISIISHDIITPIKFMAIAAKNTFRKNNTEELSHTLYDIQQTADRLYDNAQNVLNWIKYQNNLIEVKRTNIAIYPLSEDLCELLHDAAQSNKNTIINEIDPDEIILSDGIIIGILLHNLLSNAVKYVKNGQITVSFSRVANTCLIRVSDNGPGMSVQNYNRIQSILSNSQAMASSEFVEGSGLGYIIISELASLLNAEINVSNEPNKGVSVCVVIPQGN
ncbi:MAG: sensor histidine kinase [Bacteroidia bacterium]